MGYVVVVCGAAAGEVDTAERHPQSYLTGLKSGLTPVIVVVVVVREWAVSGELQLCFVTATV